MSQPTGLPQRRSRQMAVRFVLGHRRIFIGLGLGTAVILGCLLFANLGAVTIALLGWNATVIAYVGQSLRLAIVADEDRIERIARRTDEGRGTMLVLCLVASIASLVAIVMELAAAKQAGAAEGLHVTLAFVTIVCSWTFVHTAFAFHYAHEYYDAMRTGPNGGLVFPGDDRPDYFDFAYFAFVIGAAAQTADVSYCSSGMRRLGLAHCVLSFVFNTAILALFINIAAGLIG